MRSSKHAFPLIIVLTWLHFATAHAQTPTGKDSITALAPTRIEARTHLRAYDERAECQLQYVNLRELLYAKQRALNTAQGTIYALRDTIYQNDSIYTDLAELEIAMRTNLEKQLRKQKRKRMWNAILLYGATGIAIAEAGYIIFAK